MTNFLTLRKKPTEDKHKERGIWKIKKKRNSIRIGDPPNGCKKLLVNI